jgi:cytochrome d ubiquinol oxidase subunit II
VLIAFILRPVGFTFRGKLVDARWRNVWDWALFTGGAVPALLFGVAFGNLFLGVPFHFDEIQRPVYTGGFFNLLHPFALLSGLVSLSMLVMHGATYAALKVDGVIGTRAATVGRIAALVFAVAFLAAGYWLAGGIDGQRITSVVNGTGASDPTLKQVLTAPGAWLDNYWTHGTLWLVPTSAIVAALLTNLLLRARWSMLAFVASALAQAGTILTAGIALFPFLMPSSSRPEHGLTIWDASSSAKTLFIMLVAVVIFLPIILIYTAWVFRVLRGRITLETIRKHTGFY